MTTPSPRRCEWFPACQQPAVALVSRPVVGAVPTCRRCIERSGLASQIIGMLTVELPVAKPAPPPGHAAEHYFKGLCICPCGDCLERVGDGLIMCTCPGCPADRRGAKVPTGAGVR